MKKGFLIDLMDTIPTEPTADFICELIEKQCDRDNDKVRFVQKVKPVRFYLNDLTLYEASLIPYARGGQLIFCKNI